MTDADDGRVAEDPSLAHLDPRERDTIEQIRALIRIPSVNTGDPATIGDGEARAARHVQRRLIEAGYRTHYVEPAPGRGNVVARLAGEDPDAGALVVHAHLDVVPVEAEDWTHPPFAAEIHDGVLYGRGAVDMKNFAGTILSLARLFAREGVRPRRDLIFAFFADEEAGGTWGARWLVENRPDLFAGATEALGEVGGFSVPLGDGRRGYLVSTAEKGVTTATIVATGRAGHGSRPTDDNAVVRVGRALTAVADVGFDVEGTPLIDALLARLGEGTGTADGPESRLGALGHAGRLIRDGARDTAVPTVLRAGGKPNVIPSRAEAVLDVRVLPDHVDAVRSRLEAAVGPDVTIEWGEVIPAIESPVDSPLLDVVERALVAEDPGGRLLPFRLPASTDNKHLARLGIRGFGFVPLRVPDAWDVFASFHATDESIPVDSLAFLHRVTERILRSA